MDIMLNLDAEKQDIVEAVRQCGVDDAVCCPTEELFKLAKIVLVQEGLKDVTLQLLDSDGYAIRQVTSKKKGDAQKRDQLSDRQKSVVKALEKVLSHCRKEGIQLVGYSDELVALPSHVPLEEISSSGAVEVQSDGVYKGADAVIP